MAHYSLLCTVRLYLKLRFEALCIWLIFMAMVCKSMTMLRWYDYMQGLPLQLSIPQFSGLNYIQMELVGYIPLKLSPLTS